MAEEYYYIVLAALVGMGMTLLGMPFLLKYCRMRVLIPRLLRVQY